MCTLTQAYLGPSTWILVWKKIILVKISFCPHQLQYCKFGDPVTFSLSPLLHNKSIRDSPRSAAPFNRFPSTVVFIALCVMTRAQVLGNAVTVSANEISLSSAVTTSNALRVLWHFVLECQVTAVFELRRTFVILLSGPLTLISVDICLKTSKKLLLIAHN